MENKTKSGLNAQVLSLDAKELTAHKELGRECPIAQHTVVCVALQELVTLYQVQCLFIALRG